MSRVKEYGRLRRGGQRSGRSGRLERRPDWEKLSADPGSEQCGWLKDKFGLSWQIVPNAIPRLLADKDPAKSTRVMQAVMGMKKIDIAAIERAHAGA